MAHFLRALGNLGDGIEKTAIWMNRQKRWARHFRHEFGLGEFARERIHLHPIDAFALVIRIRSDVNPVFLVLDERRIVRAGREENREYDH